MSVELRGGDIVTIEDYRISLGWSITDLAKRTGLTTKTISRIERGEPAFAHNLGKIARAFSEELGRQITINDLDGANIADR